MKRLVLLLSLAGCKAAPVTSATAGAPGAPTGLSVTAGNAENILAWQASSTASRYEIQRSASKAGPYAVLAMTPLSTYTDSGLANGIAFFYVVSALNGSLASANSNEGTATPLASAGAEPPAVPAGLSAAADANSPLVTLSWNAVSGATGYVLFRAGVSGGPYTQLSTTNGTTLSDNSVVSGTDYSYVLRASAGSEQSASSGQVTVKTSGTAPPPTPSGLSAVSSSTEVALSWNASDGATAYVVSRSSASGGPYKSVATPTHTSFTDKVATGTYFYVVAASNAGAISENSSQIEATVSAPTSGGWLVGNGGSMLSINTQGLVTEHAAVTSANLNSLTCVGVSSAWAVGDSGTILYTANGGASWTAQTSHTQVGLHGVSFSTLQHGVVAGDAGTMLLTDDGGAHWSPVALAQNLAAIDLQAVKLAGSAGAAVGSGGTILLTSDSGASWAVKSSGTSVTLYGVDVSEIGAAVAVGASGTAIAFSATGLTPLQWNIGTTFYAARLLPTGGVVAVGAAGTMVHSRLTAGAPTVIVTPTTQDLYAVMVSEADAKGKSGIIAAGAGGTIIAAPQLSEPFALVTSGTTRSLRAIDDLPGL